MKPQLFIILLLTYANAVFPRNNPEEVLAQRSEKCIRKSGTSNMNYNDDMEANVLELEKRLAGAKRWKGKRVVYKIENMPECSDGLSESDVKRMIDKAAQKWNDIPRANILLVNLETLAKDSVPLPPVDVTIKFLPCEHSDPDLKHDSDFVPCEAQYAHAFFFGDIHVNSLMTWTEKEDLREEEVERGEVVMPNLYTIVLHEFGHTLGLHHSELSDQVMFGAFGGDRKHRVLELGEEDIARIQELYPPEPSCQDKSVLCRVKGESEVCLEEAKRRICPMTCGDCVCNSTTPDDYLKCTPDVCGTDLAEVCKNTCNACRKCPSLPGVERITSSANFPVKSGGVITVSCEQGYELEGASQLTCVDGQQFLPDILPTCIEEEEEEGPDDISDEEGPDDMIECKDLSSKCAKKQKQGKKCKSRWMRKNCEKTCKRCSNLI
ncbi:hypothetical protein ACHWQZ_G000753 [Mnemiopsis leidyi]